MERLAAGPATVGDATAGFGVSKPAITKHLKRVQESLLSGAELSEEDAAYAASVDKKNLERAREAGNGLLADVLEAVDPDADAEELARAVLAAQLGIVALGRTGMDLDELATAADCALRRLLPATG